MDERDREAHAAQNLWAWILLFGALAACAGHGVFLYARTAPPGWIPNFARLLERAGTTGTVVIAWFLACAPLAALAWLLRRPLLRRGWLRPAAIGATVTTEWPPRPASTCSSAASLQLPASRSTGRRSETRSRWL